MRDHYDSEMDRVADLSRTAQRLVEVGRETAARAASYIRDGVDRAAGYARELTGTASERIADVTGRPPDEWARRVRHFVEQSPVRAIVVAIAAGFLAGRVMRHG